MSDLGSLSQAGLKGEGNVTRRDFLYLSTGAVGAIGVAATAWMFIDSMNPAADTLALASVEIDLSSVKVGQAITVQWRGLPVFIRHRTQAEIEAAREITVARLRDAESDEDRVQKPEWLILLGICTHLNCIPLGQQPTDNKGEYGGWFCSCHGSEFDTSGRIRLGPAPRNLEVPKYTFLTETLVRIG